MRPFEPSLSLPIVWFMLACGAAERQPVQVDEPVKAEAEAEPTFPNTPCRSGLLPAASAECEFELLVPVEPGHECYIRIKLNDRDVDCNTDDGWILSDKRHLRLQGAACAAALEDEAATVEGVFPCAQLP